MLAIRLPVLAFSSQSLRYRDVNTSAYVVARGVERDHGRVVPNGIDETGARTGYHRRWRPHKEGVAPNWEPSLPIWQRPSTSRALTSLATSEDSPVPRSPPPTRPLSLTRTHRRPRSPTYRARHCHLPHRACHLTHRSPATSLSPSPPHSPILPPPSLHLTDPRHLSLLSSTVSDLLRPSPLLSPSHRHRHRPPPSITDLLLHLLRSIPPPPTATPRIRRIYRQLPTYHVTLSQIRRRRFPFWDVVASRRRPSSNLGVFFFSLSLSLSHSLPLLSPPPLLLLCDVTHHR